MEALELRRVSSSDDLLNPGEYLFVPKQAPKITLERKPLNPPATLWKFLWWTWFGKKYELKKTVETFWPEQDTVVVNCPACNSPCGTTKNHRIVSVEPLTLNIPLTCPYCQTKTFTIEEGKLTLTTA